MKDKEVRQALVMITQFGINMIVPIVLCMFIGYWIDRLFGTSFVVIIMFFVGALAGFTNVYKMARELYSRKKPGEEDDPSREIARLRDEARKNKNAKKKCLKD